MPIGVLSSYGTKKECTVTNNALFFFIISIPYPGNII